MCSCSRPPMHARAGATQILAILLPVSAFVAMGFEHSVANMFLLPQVSVRPSARRSHRPRQRNGHTSIPPCAARQTLASTTDSCMWRALRLARARARGNDRTQGMLHGAPITFADMMLKNIIPVTLGNIVGAGLFVAGIHAVAYNTYN